MDANGGNIRRLTDNPADDASPAWSPDGQRIAFVSYRDGNAEIYIMDTDGENQRNLTDRPEMMDFSPDWFDPAYAVFPADKLRGTWGWIKQTSK
jgi:Tol biopolymer transport system component